MLRIAAVIAMTSVIVLASNPADARRLSFSFGSKSVSKSVAPVSKPVAANASAPTSRGTFVVIGTGTSQNRPFAAAPRDPVPAPGPLHDLAYAAAQMPPADKPAEQPVEQKPEPPVVQTAPVFISHAAPVAKPVEKPAERVASAQPVKTVYCVKQANGGCAPF